MSNNRRKKKQEHKDRMARLEAIKGGLKPQPLDQSDTDHLRTLAEGYQQDGRGFVSEHVDNKGSLVRKRHGPPVSELSGTNRTKRKGRRDRRRTISRL